MPSQPCALPLLPSRCHSALTTPFENILRINGALLAKKALLIHMLSQLDANAYFSPSECISCLPENKMSWVRYSLLNDVFFHLRILALLIPCFDCVQVPTALSHLTWRNLNPHLLENSWVQTPRVQTPLQQHEQMDLGSRNVRVLCSQ